MSDWISVKDRLPKHGQQVLAITKVNNIGPGEDGPIAIFEYHDPDVDGIDALRPEMRGFHHSYWCTGVPCTHWMPIPELPKRDGGK